MHSGRCDEFLLFDGFDTLGNDLQAQCPADAYDCMHDRRVNRQTDIRYETLIDLDLIDREAAQGRQARISGAKVIERKRHAAVMQLFDGLQHGGFGIEQSRLGDLKLDAAWVDG